MYTQQRLDHIVHYELQCKKVAIMLLTIIDIFILAAATYNRATSFLYILIFCMCKAPKLVTVAYLTFFLQE